MNDPPEDAYGRVTNPKQLAPLIPAAEELTSDLARQRDYLPRSSGAVEVE